MYILLDLFLGANDTKNEKMHILLFSCSLDWIFFCSIFLLITHYLSSFSPLVLFLFRDFFPQKRATASKKISEKKKRAGGEKSQEKVLTRERSTPNKKSNRKKRERKRERPIFLLITHYLSSFSPLVLFLFRDFFPQKRATASKKISEKKKRAGGEKREREREREKTFSPCVNDDSLKALLRVESEKVSFFLKNVH